LGKGGGQAPALGPLQKVANLNQIMDCRFNPGRKAMKEEDLEYAKLVTMIKPYVDKGRPISIAFLNWMLEHIYRLDQVAAEDAICDKNNDRGLDGIYVDDNQQEIHVFQSRTKQGGTIGDKDLREFSGSLNQLRTTDALASFLAGKVDQEIKDKLINLNVANLLDANALRKAAET
jgi:hypothetical protein